MPIDSIADLIEPVRTAGVMALEAQGRMATSDIALKPDDSVITTVDPMVEGFLVEKIEAAFPEASILAEEKVRYFDPDQPYTFALDPIDGTDAFSQRMAGWCLSLGLLNRELEPIAGIIFAPRLDLLVFADVGRRAIVNGEEAVGGDKSEPLSAKSNVMVTSNIHRQLDLRRFPGKIRSIGSAALHLIGPVVYPKVFAAVDGGRGYIWDVAGAHAIVIEYFQGPRYQIAAQLFWRQGRGPWEIIKPKFFRR